MLKNIFLEKYVKVRSTFTSVRWQSFEKVNCECWVRTWLFLMLEQRLWGPSLGFSPVFGECCAKMSPLCAFCVAVTFYGSQGGESSAVERDTVESKLCLALCNEKYKLSCIGCFPFPLRRTVGKNDDSITEKHVNIILSSPSPHFYTIFASTTNSLFVCLDWHFTVDVPIINISNTLNNGDHNWYHIAKSITLDKKCIH